MGFIFLFSAGQLAATFQELLFFLCGKRCEGNLAANVTIFAPWTLPEGRSNNLFSAGIERHHLPASSKSCQNVSRTRLFFAHPKAYLCKLAPFSRFQSPWANKCNLFALMLPSLQQDRPWSWSDTQIRGKESECLERSVLGREGRKKTR